MAPDGTLWSDPMPEHGFVVGWSGWPAYLRVECGVNGKYCEADEDLVLEHGPAEAAVSRWVEHTAGQARWKIGDPTRQSVWLVLLGKPGVGKTFAAIRACKSLLRRVGDQARPRYVFAPDLLVALKDSQYGKDPWLLDFVAGARELFVDDLDRVLDNPREAEASAVLWDAFSEKLDARGISVIVTCNRRPGDLETIGQLARWLDRVRGNGEIVEAKGRSFRGR